MSKKILSLFLFVLISIISSGQNINISGVILNKNDKKPIPYVSIYSIKSNIFYDADLYGNYEISIPFNDTIIFSSIGYENLILSNFILHDSIYLNEKIHQLKDVIVAKSIPIEVGILNNKVTRSFIGESLNDSYEAVTLINVPEAIGQFKISKIKFKQKSYSSDMILKLHVYETKANNLPGDELLNNQVIISSKDNKNGIIEIDIKNQNIILANSSFFVGVQFITKNKISMTSSRRNDIGLGETNRLSEKLTYRRSRALNYTWYVDYETGIYIPGIKGKTKDITPMPLRGNPVNMLASAIIEIL